MRFNELPIQLISGISDCKADLSEGKPRWVLLHHIKQLHLRVPLHPCQKKRLEAAYFSAKKRVVK